MRIAAAELPYLPSLLLRVHLQDLVGGEKENGEAPHHHEEPCKSRVLVYEVVKHCVPREVGV